MFPTLTLPSVLSPQVVAIDLDEGPNGRVTYRMQVGMPRMDFLINSTSGLVTSTAVLDRERIAEYYLRVVASDAGAPSKSSTSTLTVKGPEIHGLSSKGCSGMLSAAGMGFGELAAAPGTLSPSPSCSAGCE